MAFGIPRPMGGPAPVNLPSGAPQQLAMPAPPPQAPPSPLEQMSSQMMAPIAQALQPKPKINWLGVLADALAGASGRQGPYASMLMQQRQDTSEEARYQRHKGDDLQNQIALYAYKAAHPDDQPGETERMISELVKMAPDDPRRSYYENAVQHPVAMDVTGADGSVTRQYVYPNSIQHQPRVFTSLPPDATPIDGGPTPSASGTFHTGHK